MFKILVLTALCVWMLTGCGQSLSPQRMAEAERYCSKYGYTIEWLRLPNGRIVDWQCSPNETP